MTAAAKAKGSRYESAVCDTLQGLGVKAKRLPRAGANDIGDAAFPLSNGTLILELKARKQIDLAQFVKESLIESANYEVKYPAEAPAFGAAVVKRRQKSIEESYVVMELSEFVDMLKSVGAV